MKRSLVILLVTAIALTACGVFGGASSAPTVSEYPQEAIGMGGAAPEMARDMALAPAPTAGFYDEKAYQSSGAPAPAQERMVIQNADLTIVVPDPKARMDAIAAMAKRMGGFVVTSNLYQSYLADGQVVPEGSIMVRIPAEKLDEALKEIKENTVEVQNENLSGQDVTQTYVDLKSRLKNLEAAEAQLQSIMDKAEKTEDVINVFNQLVYYREQIELVKGQMQYYEEAAALSAISVRVVAEETIKPIEIGGWKPEGVARDAVQALVDFFQGFVDFLIWLVIFILPVVVLLMALGWLIWRFLRALWRRFFPRKTPPPPPAA